MKTTNRKIGITQLVVVGMMGLTTLSGCFNKQGDATSALGRSSGGGGGGAAPTAAGGILAGSDAPVALSTAGTAGVRHFLQIRESMAAVTGVNDSANTAIQNFYNVQTKPVYSVDGRADSVSPAMLLAILGLAGLYCQQLITNDKALAAANRIAFAAVDFTKDQTQFTAATKAAVIGQLAQLFWRRSPTATEVTALSTAIDETVLNQTKSTTQTQNAMQVVCSAALASLDFVQL